MLSVHVVDGWEEGCQVSLATLHHEGLGHTLGLWARDERVMNAWFLEKPANRIVVNGPTSEGAVGYSTNLMPSMSLGCGPQAGNITSDNISARHLINVKRAAFPRRDWETIWAKDHARAHQFGGERAPRGSKLPGDPRRVRERCGPRDRRAQSGSARGAETEPRWKRAFPAEPKATDWQSSGDAEARTRRARPPRHRAASAAPNPPSLSPARA